MPTCACCGEQQFDCIDGLFYCQTCQTQSQEVRVEVEEDSLVGVYTASLAIRGKANVKEKVTTEVDKGRPWLSHEAFTIILREQTHALIRLGADPKLEDVVLRLWIRYLSIGKVAFVPPDDHSGLEEGVSINSTCRIRARDDLSCLVGDKSTTRRKVSARSKAHKLQDEAKQRNEMQEMAALLADVDFYEGDNPVNEDEMDGTTSSEDEGCEDDAQEDRVIQRRDKCYMTMQKTLFFLYLGLHFTNNLVMTFDIVRWVLQGHIPYGKKIGDILPADMKFHEGDVKMFCNGYVPSSHEIRQRSGAMAHFLGIKRLPVVNMQALISRFVLELNLPGEVHALAQGLLRSLPMNVAFRCRTIVPYEKFAMSYIIIILKMLFGVDDDLEKKWSSYASSINKSHPTGQRLFVWSEWVYYMERRMAVTKRNILPTSEEAIKCMRGLNACIRSYQKTSGQSAKYARTHDKCTYRTEELRHSLQQPFLHLMSRQATNEDRDEDEVPCVDFTTCSLRYLTEDVDYLANNNQGNLSDATIYSSCVEDDDDDDGDDNDCAINRSRDLFVLPRRRRKLPLRNSAKRAVRQVLNRFDATSPTMNRHRGALPSRPQAACECYTVYNLNSVPADRHRAYEQLLKFCDSCCDSGTEMLHACVQRLQIMCIMKEEDFTLAERRIHRRFRYTYLSDSRTRVECVSDETE